MYIILVYTRKRFLTIAYIIRQETTGYQALRGPVRNMDAEGPTIPRISISIHSRIRYGWQNKRTIPMDE